MSGVTHDSPYPNGVFVRLDDLERRMNDVEGRAGPVPVIESQVSDMRYEVRGMRNSIDRLRIAIYGSGGLLTVIGSVIAALIAKGG